MLALVRFFTELALLRRGPQDLPVSGLLLGLLAVLSVFFGTLNGRDMFGTVRAAFGANLFDLVLTLSFLWALLQVRGQLARWQQTATAFFGLGALAGFIMVLVRGAAEAVGVLELAMLADLTMAVWLHVAFGNVLRHALEVPLLAGVLIMLSYTILAFNLIVSVFPLVTMTE